MVRNFESRLKRLEEALGSEEDWFWAEHAVTWDGATYKDLVELLTAPDEEGAYLAIVERIKKKVRDRDEREFRVQVEFEHQVMLKGDERLSAEEVFGRELPEIIAELEKWGALILKCFGEEQAVKLAPFRAGPERWREERFRCALRRMFRGAPAWAEKWMEVHG